MSSLCMRRLSHMLLQTSLFKYSFRRCSSFKVFQPPVPGITLQRGTSDILPSTPSFELSSETQESASEETRLEPKMKAFIEDELKGATYYVDLTHKDGILYADPRTVEAVNNSLQTTFRALSSGGVSSATNPRLPVQGFLREHRSYKPLVHLLNKIIDAANRHMPPSQLSQLRFQTVGGEDKETYGCHRDLKPEGVGIIGKLSTENKKPAKECKFSWEQIEVVVNSKASVRDMVRHSGTYARCCLLSNRRRFFSLGIGFDYKKMEAYVFVFHRAGLSSSRPLKVTTGEGFKGLVDHIVGILSFKDEAAYCLDTTCFQNLFCINDRYFKMDRLLYTRGSLRGRSTTIYGLQASKDTFQHDLKSRKLMLSKGVVQVPDKLTYKLTYPVKGSSQEGRILSQFNGQFGIADVIGYHDCGPEDPHSSTGRLSNKAEFWNVFKEDFPEGKHHKPEERGLHCIALSGEGKALVDLYNLDGGVPSPGKLLESILHAIIGHYNLFDKGILHRDISAGNILQYSEPIWRPALDKFECTRNVNYCRGFLIDGDQAVKWRELSGSQSISGTIPFISVRILVSWAWQPPQPIIHTALDDLESFLWVLLWGIAHASKDIRGGLTANRGIERILDAWSGNISHNIDKILAAERTWTDRVFGDLIKDWLDTLRTADRESSQVTEDMSFMCLGSQEWTDACNDLESYSKGIYKKILESGFQHLEGVREYSDWDAAVAANIRRR